jgi:hypothetical protein
VEWCWQGTIVLILHLSVGGEGIISLEKENSTYYSYEPILVLLNIGHNINALYR